MSTEIDPNAAETATDVGQDEKIRIDSVGKVFGRVVALDDVSLTVTDNEILAIVGDNGAGKSTLMNIICGAQQPSEGAIYYEGRQVDFRSPEDARDAGIETVYQDLALMDDLDVATNIFMGNFPRRKLGPLSLIDWDGTYDRAEQIITERLHRDLNPRAEVEFHSGGERQLIAIARALAFDPEVVILDEPTSALSVDATELVHETVRELKADGRTIIIVSHSMEEVFGLADRIAVLFQGQLVDIVETDTVDPEAVKRMMTSGRSP